MKAQLTEIMMLSKNEQLFAFKRMGKSMKKWKRKQLKKSKQMQFDFTQFNIEAKRD